MSRSKSWHISLRGRKILRDLWVNKARSLLIVLAVTVGVSAFGLMISGSIVLEQNLKDVYAATNPAHTILTLQSFDDGLISKVGDLLYIHDVQPGRSTQARLETSSGKWLNLDLSSVPNFSAISINRLSPASDAPKDSILFEESLQNIAQVGESVKLKMLNGEEHMLKVAGYINDLSILPAGISLIGNGYISMDTAQSLGLPTDYNRLYVTFKDVSSRADIERKLPWLTGYLERQDYVVYSAPIPQPDKYVLGGNMTSVLLILQTLGLLTLILSALLVTSVMSAVIAQQIPQIGILKSIGARFHQMMVMYFQQVLAFCLVALLFAIPLWLVGAYFLASGGSGTLNLHVPHFYLPSFTVLLQAGSALLIPLLASSIPIVAGARMTIHDAISGYRSGEYARLGWPARTIRNLPQLVNISLRNAFRRKGRLVLTFAALVLAGAMFIAVLGIRQSLGQAVADIQGSLNYDVGVNFDQSYPVTLIKDKAMKVDGVNNVETWLIADARIVFEEQWLSGSILIQGVPADTTMAKPGVIAGCWLEPNDTYALFVNSDFLALSSDLHVGSKVKLRVGGADHEWTIICVSARSIIPTAYVHYNELPALTSLTDFANRLVVDTESNKPEYQARVQTDLSAALDLAGLQVAHADITTEAKEAAASQLDSIITLLLSMVILVALVGGLGLAITMGLNVLERTREIGILRALGAKNDAVRRVVVLEALVIGLISWAVAILLSIPLAIFLGNSLGISLLARPLDYVFSIPAVLLWFVLVVVISMVASALPARNAARLTIRDALTYE